jgi:hypothetical protein
MHPRLGQEVVIIINKIDIYNPRRNPAGNSIRIENAHLMASCPDLRQRPAWRCVPQGEPALCLPVLTLKIHPGHPDEKSRIQQTLNPLGVAAIW